MDKQAANVVRAHNIVGHIRAFHHLVLWCVGVFPLLKASARVSANSIHERDFHVLSQIGRNRFNLSMSDNKTMILFQLKLAIVFEKKN